MTRHFQPLVPAIPFDAGRELSAQHFVLSLIQNTAMSTGPAMVINKQQILIVTSFIGAHCPKIMQFLRSTHIFWTFIFLS